MTLGLFAPLPLPVMIPFMGYQSLVMGEAFGLSYQFAKRKISAMTNEEFNKLTIAEVQQMLRKDIQSAIPDMKASMNDMLTLQKDMINYAVDALAQLPSDIYHAVVGGDNVEQGEQGLPLGIASFLRPLLEPGIGGLKHSTKQLTPDVVVGSGDIVTATNQEELFDIGGGSTSQPTVDPFVKAFERKLLDGSLSTGYTSQQIQQAWNQYLSVGGNKLLQGKLSQLVGQIQLREAKVHTSTQEKIQSQLVEQQQKQKLPSDPRTIVSQRNELIKVIASLSEEINTLSITISQASDPKKREKLANQKITLNKRLKTAQADLTALLMKYDFTSVLK